ncbi:MAG: PHP domain-containing protein [Chlamydiales bacterium]
MNDTFRADLHCHSTCSDGTLTPVKLIQLAKQNGLSGLAITDHDTIEAYQTAPEEAKKCGILLGSGVELSCSFKKQNIHLLGYDFSLASPEMHSFCAKHLLRRNERNEKIVAKLAKMRMPMTLEEIKRANPLTTTIGRPHIAKCMLEKGYVKTIKEAFNSYIGDGKPCYDGEDAFSVEETIDLIHLAGGKAFVAHPHLLESQTLIRDLLKLPFDGIECHYGRFLPGEEKKWQKLAASKGLLMSGGSDFHGHEGYVSLGSSWVDEVTFKQIFQRA